MMPARAVPRILLASLLAVATPSLAQDKPLVAGENGVPVPKKTKHVQPEYPPEARAQGIRGIVILDLVIDANGRVTDATVLRGIPGLDEAALAAARRWEFEPVKVDGKPVGVRLTQGITFALQLPRIEREAGVPELRQGVSPKFPAGTSEAGRAAAEVSLEPDGRIGTARIVAGDEPWAGALLSALQTWRFGLPPEDAELTFRVHAEFVPTRGAEPARVLLKAGSVQKSDLLASSAPAATAPTTTPQQATPPATAPTGSAATPPADTAPAATTPAPAAPPVAAAPEDSGTAPPATATPVPPAAEPPARPADETKPASPKPQEPSPATPPPGAPAAPGSTPDAPPPISTPERPASPGPDSPGPGATPPAATPTRPTPPPASAPAADRTAPPPVEVINAPPPVEVITAPPPQLPPENGISAIRDITLQPGVPDLTHGRRPVAPPLARMASANGTVEVQFSVSAAGGTTVQSVAGPDLLKKGAEQAVVSWVFRRTRADRAYLSATFTFDADKASAVVKPQAEPPPSAAIVDRPATSAVETQAGAPAVAPATGPPPAARPTSQPPPVVTPPEAPAGVPPVGVPPTAIPPADSPGTPQP